MRRISLYCVCITLFALWSGLASAERQALVAGETWGQTRSKINANDAELYDRMPTGDVVGATDAQVLTNKSIDAGQLTGALDAARLPDAVAMDSELPPGALDAAYDAAGWDGSQNPPTRNAVRDKIELMQTEIDGKPDQDIDTHLTEAEVKAMVADDLAGKSDTTHNHAGVYEPANSNIQSHISVTDVHLSSDERAAMSAANAPSGTNALATMDDVAAIGGGYMLQSVYDADGDNIINDVAIPDSVARDSELPTATSDLTNDSGFITNVNSLALATLSPTEGQIAVYTSGAWVVQDQIDLTAPGEIGASVPAAGHFTSLTATSFDFGQPASGETGELALLEDPGNGTNVVGFKAAANLAADLLWELPAADGADNYCLATDGAFGMKFVEPMLRTDFDADHDGQIDAGTIPGIIARNIETTAAPVAAPLAGDSCTPGTWSYNALFVHVCGPDGTWGRVATSGWTNTCPHSSVGGGVVGESGVIDINQDVTYNGQLIMTDDDGDSITYNVVSHASMGAETVNSDGSFTYQPLPSAYGSDHFSFLANDGLCDSLVLQVDIDVNDIPDAVDDNLAVTLNTQASGTLFATDNYHGALTYSVVAGAGHGVVTITDSATGAYTYDPATDYTGPDSFTFSANDGYADSNTATISVTIN